MSGRNRGSQRTAEIKLLGLAALAGLVHAGFSLYWGLGGRWLLATVGQWAVDLARDAPVTAGLVLVLVAALKAAVAVVPLLATRRQLPFPGVLRAVSWLAALVLALYGGLNSVVAWLVLSGVLRPAGGYDHQAMVGHGFLWDPLFLVWGLLLGLGLYVGRRSRLRTAAGGG